MLNFWGEVQSLPFLLQPVLFVALDLLDLMFLCSLYDLAALADLLGSVRLLTCSSS